MSYKILFRRGTDTEWSTSNPILGYGEVGCETGEFPQLKVGDGMTPWNDLPYAGSGIGVVPGGDTGALLTKDSSTNYDTSWVSRSSLAEDESFSERFEYKVAIDVREHGALIDGITDDSVAIQAAIDAAAVSGGIVKIPAGTSIISTAMILKTNVVIEGAGVNLTTIKLSPNANCAAFETVDFSTLNAGNTAAGPHSFALRDMTIDGNKIYNATSFGLKIYGYGFELSRLRIIECDNNGIYSKWSTDVNHILPNDMMSTIYNVQVHDCTGDGIYWNGPHSSTFINTHVYKSSRGFVIETNGSNTRLIGCSTYGVGQSWGFYLNAPGTNLVSCLVQSAGTNDITGGQIFIGANNVSIQGAHLNSNGAGVTSDNVRGIVIGNATPVSGYGISVNIVGCLAGSIHLVNDNGGFIEGTVNQASGNVVNGVASPNTKISFSSLGAATYADVNSDITASEILASLVTVDGTGSGLDADLLDGQHASAFATLAAVAAGYQPIDSDLTAIAALTTTTYGRALLTLANQAALVSAVGSATDTTSGVIELATTSEVTTGTDTVRAATPAGVKAAIDAAVAGLIASAPGVLDTLDEIAAALGDDPNFAATITTALAGKQPLDSDLTAIASLSTTSFGRSVLTLADAAAGRTLFGAEVSGAVATHEAAADPHTNYVLSSELETSVEALMTPLVAGPNIQLVGSTISAKPLFARLTSNTTSLVNNSTTLVDITGMSVALEANSVYELRGMIIYSADTAADFKMGWTVPAGTTGTWAALAMQSSSATANSSTSARWQTQTDYTETEQLGGVGTGITSESTRSFALFQGLVITSATAGNIVMRGAQQTAHASDAGVGIGTYMVLTRVV